MKTKRRKTMAPIPPGEKDGTAMTRHTRTILAAVLFFAALIACVIWVRQAVRANGHGVDQPVSHVKSRVLEIMDEDLEWDERYEVNRGFQDLRVEIQAGEYKGEIIEVRNPLIPLYNTFVKPGSAIVLSVFKNDGVLVADVYSHYRLPYYVGFVVLFFVVMALIGGKKGVKSMLGLVFTLFCILYLFLPMLFLGVSPVLAAIAIGVVVSCVSLVLLNGFSRKTLAATLGTVLGVAVAGGMAWIAGTLTNITTYSSGEADDLILLAQDMPIRLSGLLFAGVIIAALGAVMDVGMSISSSVWEIHSMDPRLSRRDLFRSGMNVTRDISGTMSNTLVLAFVGSSMNLIVVLYAFSLSFTQLINSNVIGIEILQSVSGTMGMLSAGPITAYLAAVLFEKRKES